MRISDWSSDVCSSDLAEGKTVIIVTHDASVAARAERVIEISDGSIVADRRNPDAGPVGRIAVPGRTQQRNRAVAWRASLRAVADRFTEAFVMALRSMKAHRLRTFLRSEEHTSELQSLMRIPYAVLCLKKKKTK